MASLGSLVVSLTAETAQFRTSMERASRTAETNFRKIEGLAKNAGLALAGFFTITQTAGFIKGAIDAADALNDLSERTGVAVDELSRLTYAGQLADVTQEQLSGAIQKLSRGMAEAAQGTGTAKEALDAMGISIRDSNGNLRSSDEMLKVLADKFATYQDGVEKSALAQAIFGKSGAEMITFLNLGRKGIEDLGKEAERLGMVVFPDVAKRAGEFNDNLDKLKGVSSGVAREIGNALIPTLNKLMNEFLLLQKHGLGFFDVLNMGLRFGGYEEQLATINKELSSTSFFLTDARKESLLRQKAVLEEALALKKLAESEKSANNEKNKEDKQKGKAPEVAKNKDKEKAQADEALRMIEAQTDALNKLRMTEVEYAEGQIFLAGGTMEQVQRMRELVLATQQLSQEQDRAREQTQYYVDLAGEFNDLLKESASKVQQLADEEARLEDLRKRLIDAGYNVALVEDRIAEARMNAADKIMGVAEKTKDLENVYKEFGSAIGTAFEDAILQGKGLQDVLKGLEQDIIRILMRKFVTQPLESAVTSFATSMMSSFMGPRAMGGPVRANAAYLVGERGPELFIPNASGSIASNSDIRPASGNQITVQNNFTITGAMDRRSQIQIAAATGQGIQRAMGRNT